MGWGEVDDKLALLLELEDLQGIDEADREAICNVVREEFPSLSARRVAQAIDAFLASAPKPCHREALITFLRHELHGEIGADDAAIAAVDVSRGTRGPQPARMRGVGRMAGSRARSRPARGRRV